MTAPAASPARDLLTQTDAEVRAARIAGVSYEFSLDLRRGLSHAPEVYD